MTIFDHISVAPNLLANTLSAEMFAPMVGGLALLQQEPASLWKLFVPWVLIFGIFYFIAIRPARLKQKELASQIEELKKGDKVITTGGIYGEIAGVDGGTLILKIADDTKIRILKSGIAGLDATSQS